MRKDRGRADQTSDMKIQFHPLSRNPAAFSGVNLLVVLTLALVGLIGWQWKRETLLFTENQKLKESVQQDHGTKHQLQQSIENLQSEIQRIELERKNANAVTRSNQMQITDLAKKLAAIEYEARLHSNTTTQYKIAFERATNQLYTANSNMVRANEVIVAMRKSVDDRNEIVARLNDTNKKYAELMTERNQIVDKFNSFVKEVEAERAGEKVDKNKK
jgi:sensor histidine kinase YesM